MMSEAWRNTKQYEIWRENVLKKYNHTCVICKSKENLEAHHLFHSKYYPAKRFNVNNGVCLCRNCHVQFHTNFKKNFQEKCTKYDFENFKQLAKYFKKAFQKSISKKHFKNCDIILLQ